MRIKVDMNNLIDCLMFVFLIQSNVSYHGDLEKKAAMEQKRTLGGDGDEANGHEDSGSGIYQQFSLSRRMRKKRVGRDQKTSKIAFPVASPIRQQMDQGKKSRCALIRPISIPEAFVIKPAPPSKCYRTGKVWSRKRSPTHTLKRGEGLAKSSSDSNLLNRKSNQQHRRHSYWELDDQNVQQPDNSPSNSSSPLHSPIHTSSFSPVWLESATGCSSCSYCLADLTLIMQSNARFRNMGNLLFDFLPSNSFQHIILWQ